MLDIDGLNVRLATLDDRMVQWSEADNAVIQPLRQQNASPTAVIAAVQRARKERAASGTPNPFDELGDLLDQVCETYLTTTPESRGTIRVAFNSKERVLEKLAVYVGRAVKQVMATKDPHWLRMGLAAVSILDQRTDLQDMLIYLGDLYRAAHRAGIDPQPHFAAVAEQSSTLYPGAMGSMQDILAKYHESDYFRESVLPELNDEM